ncbi:hypothetical protein HHK36_022660 [Tetracentron sinense]|uniref:Uncharacterized protein n=1 Tax=Tetracentron sinense TaxID=13715 RepID=A0A834YTH8_TETSI|nr:hypothetical protein HHK36_022660 [Tetracentron sinense]
MAASAAMQSVFASPITRVTHRTRTRLVLPSTLVPRHQKNASMQVRCMANQRQQEETTPGTPTTAPGNISTKFSYVSAFSGPAPERINGRLAMIGFVAAMAVELSKGEDVFAQLANGGIPWFVGTSILLSVASLIPLLKGIRAQSKSEGVMTSDAEMWNDRFHSHQSVLPFKPIYISTRSTLHRASYTRKRFELQCSASFFFFNQNLGQMAASAAVQPIFASPVTRVTHRTRLRMVLPSTLVPRHQKNARMQVRCMAEERQQEETQTTPITIPPPPTTPKVSTKFSDVLAFSGPGPERINGRLAMIGFVAAIAVELSKGEDLSAQLANGGILWFVGTSIVLSVASLIPLLNGISVQSKSEGVMTSDAEMLNGRFAMLGLVALALTENVTGGALV